MALDFANIFTRSVTAIIFGMIFFGTIIFLPPIVSAAMFILIFYSCSLELYKLFKNKSYFWLLLPFYPAISFLIMIYFAYVNKLLLLWLFASVFIFDTGAYFFGSALGKHKLCPKISPNKSWEGFFGGLVTLTLVLACFWRNIINVTGGTFIIACKIIVISCVISILCVIGDFFESYLKRRAGVKDSGKLLPGHGGTLDRFDSAIFVAPFFLLLYIL